MLILSLNLLQVKSVGILPGASVGAHEINVKWVPQNRRSKSCLTASKPVTDAEFLSLATNQGKGGVLYFQPWSKFSGEKANRNGKVFPIPLVWTTDIAYS